MQLTLLKVIAVINIGWGIPFPWWMWLWGIMSELNGLVKETAYFRNLQLELERMEGEKKNVSNQG